MPTTSRKVIYPGTFDPITFGHLDLISRARNFADEIIVAVAENSSKLPCFELQERIEIAEIACTDIPNVKVIGFKCLLVELAEKMDARLILRGLRAVSDFEYEFQLAIMNRHLNPRIESIFLTPNEKFTFISSTIVKEVAKLGGELKDFVPASVEKRLRAVYSD